MAEAAAALYAVETAVEGAVLGGIAVSKATVPLHVKFQKIESPDASLGRTNHTLSIVDNRAYVLGGDVQDGQPDSSIRCIILPTDLAPKQPDVDYQLIESEAAPERPLASYSDHSNATSEKPQPNEVPAPRAAHAATTLGSNIYIFGGRPPNSPNSSPFDEQGTIHAFSTVTKKWTTLHPHQTRCAQGIPPPRTHATLTSTPHPTTSASLSTTSSDTEHQSGTLFLHSGYNSPSSPPLRDVWAYDISSRGWSPYPDIPPPTASETPGEGRLIESDSRLWRVGDGFGVVYYLDLVRDEANDAWGDKDTELGVSPKTGVWEKISFMEEQISPLEDSEKTPEAKTNVLPMPRSSATLVPITTGAGRMYLLYFLGSSAPNSPLPINDMWSFQIPSTSHSLASAKDAVREKIGKGSGVNEWAKCEIVEANKEDGEIERPSGGLEGAASDVWGAFGGGKIVLWGGRGGDGEVRGVRNVGWVVGVE